MTHPPTAPPSSDALDAPADSATVATCVSPGVHGLSRVHRHPARNHPLLGLEAVPHDAHVDRPVHIQSERALVPVLAFVGIVVAVMQTLLVPVIKDLPQLPGNATWVITSTLLSAEGPDGARAPAVNRRQVLGRRALPHIP